MNLFPHFFPAFSSPLRETRLLRFSAEAAGEQAPLEVRRTEQPERQMPRNDAEGREYIESLIKHTEEELNQRVRTPLQQARQRLEWARANIPNIPPDGRQHLESLLRDVNAEIQRQEVGGLLQYIGGVTIEYQAGQTRPMKMQDGSTRNVLLHHAYGSHRTAYGADGEHQDFYLGPNVDRCTTIYRVNQGDEIKDMIGFDSPQDALAAYLQNHPERTANDVPMPTAMPVEEYRRLFSGATPRAA